MEPCWGFAIRRRHLFPGGDPLHTFLPPSHTSNPILFDNAVPFRNFSLFPWPHSGISSAELSPKAALEADRYDEAKLS